MSNPGNSGQRYKMSKFAKVEPYDHPSGRPAIQVTLACGHSYIVLDGNTALFERFIAQDKRTRCNDCPIGGI